MLSTLELENLRDFLAEYGSVRAVYYYRELHSWISSDSQQMAKAGLATKPTAFRVGLLRIYTFPLKVAAVFGQENSTFIRFEDAIQTGICDTFLATFGLPTLTELGGAETVENQSVSDAAVNALFEYNRRFPRDSKERDPEEVERLKSLPGSKYLAAAFTAPEIAEYKSAREEVSSKLGLVLAPPDSLPVERKLPRRIARGWFRRVVNLGKRFAHRYSKR